MQNGGGESEQGNMFDLGCPFQESLDISLFI